MQTLSPALYRDLVEFAPNALIVVDASGTILYANSHAHTLFGYRAGELNGLSVETLIPEESRQAHTSHRCAYVRDPRLREMGNRATYPYRCCSRICANNSNRSPGSRICT